MSRNKQLPLKILTLILGIIDRRGDGKRLRDTGRRFPGHDGGRGQGRGQGGLLSANKSHHGHEDKCT